MMNNNYGLDPNQNYSMENGHEMPDENGRVSRPRTTLKNGAIFEGQWFNNLRDGAGTQEWPDGSKYEGFWS